MIRIAVATLLVAASTTLTVAATDDEIREELVDGSWGKDAECAEGSLTFEANGTLVVRTADDRPEKGYWSLTDDILTATDMPVSTVTISGDTLSLGDPEGGPRVEQFARCP